jgi:hypothetical protein
VIAWLKKKWQSFLWLLRKLKQTNEDYKKMSGVFDARDELYRLLDKYFLDHGEVPAKYEHDWQTHLRDTRPWRKIPGMRFGIWFSCFRGALAQ